MFLPFDILIFISFYLESSLYLNIIVISSEKFSYSLKSLSLLLIMCLGSNKNIFFFKINQKSFGVYNVEIKNSETFAGIFHLRKMNIKSNGIYPSI